MRCLFADLTLAYSHFRPAGYTGALGNFPLVNLLISLEFFIVKAIAGRLVETEIW